MDDTEALLGEVAAWARRRRDVHAAILVGSQARADEPADRWSDVDIVLVVDDPAPYAASAAWLEAFGQPLLTFMEPTAVGPFTERRALFADGNEVDFALVALSDFASAVQQPEVAAVFGRGFRVLVDKPGLAAALHRHPSPPPRRQQPTADAFDQLTNDFWYHALWAAKKLRRGEVWVAKASCDCHLKRLLVTLLAWHAAAADPGLDTWHGGRFLERWADPRALADLRQAFARYDADDVRAALWATVDLFEWVQRELAQRASLELRVPYQQARKRLAEILTPPS